MNKETKELQARMEKQRKSVRKEQMMKTAERRIEVEGIRDGFVLGRDEKGRKINLKVDFDGWKVILGRRVELIAEIGQDFKEGDPIPRKTIYSSYDIYGAVRSLKHLRVSYRTELNKNEAFFKTLDSLHSLLASKGSGLKNEDLQKIANELEGDVEDLSKKRSAYKLLARWKLEDVPGMLREASESADFFRRSNTIGAACAKLVAFKNRFGKWRERQVFNISGYNRAREEGLRRVRDSRLRDFLIESSIKLESENGFGVASTIVSDWDAIQKIRKARNRITERKNDEALALVEECGKALPKWLRPGLREAYSFISASMKENQNGWRNQARKMLGNFARYLGQRNTKYIQIELIKTQDTYLKDVISSVDKGNAAIREAVKNKELKFWRKKRLVKQAASHFRHAAIGLAVL